MLRAPHALRGTVRVPGDKSQYAHKEYNTHVAHDRFSFPVGLQLHADSSYFQSSRLQWQFCDNGKTVSRYASASVTSLA